MMIILSAKSTTKIVNMRSEQDSPFIFDRIIHICTIFGVKALSEPLYFTYSQKQVQHKITQADVTNHIHACPLIHKLCMSIAKLNVLISEIAKGRAIHPWKSSSMIVHLTCLSKKQPDCTWTNSVNNLCLRRIQEWLIATSNNMEQNWTSTTQTELPGILLATEYWSRFLWLTKCSSDNKFF